MSLATTSTGDRARLLRLATYASVGTATLLILVKLVAWVVTGSVSVMASLVDSLMDVGASLVNLLAVRWSLYPADAEHRFGHGKAESLAGLGQATFIVGSALFLGLHAVDRLLHPQPLADLGVGVGVMLFAMAATLILLGFQRYVVRVTGSTAIRADALHYATDLATNGATLIALFAVMLGWPGLDPILALGIAVYILYSAVQIAREAVDLLMDKELPPEDRKRIETIARAVPLVLGMHDLRTRRSGQIPVIQLHLELDDSLRLLTAHQVCDRVEAALLAEFPGADITIHQDPRGLGPAGCGPRARLSEGDE